MEGIPVIERRDGVAVLTLPAGACTVCDTRLAERNPGQRVKTTACEEHATTLGLSLPTRPGVQVILRQPRGDRTAVVHQMVHHAKSVLDRNNDRVENILSVAQDPQAWGIEPGCADEARAATAVAWAVSGTYPTQMQAFYDAGVAHPNVAANWLAYVGSPEDAVAWIRLGMEPYQAREWVYAGFTPDTVPSGLSDAKDWLFTDLARAPATPEWAALRAVANPNFVEVAVAQGQTPVAAHALAVALRGAHRPTQGSRPPQRYTFERGRLSFEGAADRGLGKYMSQCVRALDGLDWADVAACIRTGMGPKQAKQFVRSGADMGPIRLVAALSER